MEVKLKFLGSATFSWNFALGYGKLFEIWYTRLYFV